MMNQTSEALSRQLNIEPGRLRIGRIEMPASATLMLAQFPVATNGGSSAISHWVVFASWLIAAAYG
jgi:hypothetical protein